MGSPSKLQINRGGVKDDLANSNKSGFAESNRDVLLKSIIQKAEWTNKRLAEMQDKMRDNVIEQEKKNERLI